MEDEVAQFLARAADVPNYKAYHAGMKDQLGALGPVRNWTAWNTQCRRLRPWPRSRGEQCQAISPVSGPRPEAFGAWPGRCSARGHQRRLSAIVPTARTSSSARLPV